jgi:hypothetical protein
MIKDDFQEILNGMKYRFIRQPHPTLAYEVEFDYKGKVMKISLKQDDSGMFTIQAQGGIPVHVEASELDFNDVIYANEGMMPPSPFLP